MSTKEELKKQLQKLRQTGFDNKLQKHAVAHSVPVSYFFGIASRETNCNNELGDYRDGEYHGVGIIQIDIQHDIARQARDNGTWKTNPDPLIEFGAQMLQDNIKQAGNEFPDLEHQQLLRIAASGYNCGIRNAIAGAHDGDSDQSTTGQNYGRDVMTRMSTFEELLREGG
jgi:hypothetical protein